VWLDESKLRIFFDMHLPDWPEKGVAGNFDSANLANAFVASGADSVIFYAKCQYGNFYTSLPSETLHPGLGGKDLLMDTTRLLAEKGLRTLAYYSVSWDERICEEYPDWMAVNAAGERGKGPYRWRALCINSPYADLVEKHLVALAKKPIDGLWVDMTIIGDGHCYCPRCRKSFFDAYGTELPESDTDSGYGNFLEFRYNLVEAFYARIRAAVKQTAPGLAFTNNYWGYPYSSKGMGSRAVGAVRQTDFVTGEAYTDWTGIRATSFLPIFLRGVADGRPYESLIGRFVNTWDYTVKPTAFLSYEAFSVFAHGATVTVDDQPYFDGRIDEVLYSEDLASIFGEINKHRSSVRGESVRYAGIYHSQKSKNLQADPSKFIRDIAGTFRLLRDLHLQVDFVFDEDLTKEKLESLGVLILSNSAGLGESEWNLLESFARQGGLLIASGLFGDDSVVRRLETLGLRRGDPSPFSLSYLRFPGLPRDVLVRGTYVPYQADRGGRGEIVDPICETTPDRFFHNNLPSPHTPTGVAGLWELPLGKGLLAAFSQPIFRHYAKQPSRELRELVGELVTRHAVKPLFTLQIPMKMDYSLYQEGLVYSIHLLNPNAEPSLCCGLMDTLDGNFERSYEYMEEIVPVRDLRILVNTELPFRVETLREGSAVAVYSSESGSSILLDRVGLWEILKVTFLDEEP